MKITMLAFLLVLLCQEARAQQSFEEVWRTQWRSQVSGNFISRRFEPQLKAACKEVWDTAQANMPQAKLAKKKQVTITKPQPTTTAFAAVRRRPHRRFFGLGRRR